MNFLISGLMKKRIELYPCSILTNRWAFSPNPPRPQSHSILVRFSAKALGLQPKNPPRPQSHSILVRFSAKALGLQPKNPPRPRIELGPRPRQGRVLATKLPRHSKELQLLVFKVYRDLF